jgi:hypothetical protein
MENAQIDAMKDALTELKKHNKKNETQKTMYAEFKSNTGRKVVIEVSDIQHNVVHGQYHSECGGFSIDHKRNTVERWWIEEQCKNTAIEIRVIPKLNVDIEYEDRVSIKFNCERDLKEKCLYIEVWGHTFKATPSTVYKWVRDFTYKSFSKLEQYEHEHKIKYYEVCLTQRCEYSGDTRTTRLSKFKPFYTVGDDLALKMGGKIWNALTVVRSSLG